MASTLAAPDRKLGFLFADHLVLDESPTRDFYKELLRGLAHKNNNLLAVVQGFSSLILMTDGLDENTQESVTEMRTAALHHSNLSERILTAGGCARLSPQSLQLRDFLPLMESKFAEICRACGAEFSMTLAPRVSPVLADASRLKEAILELLHNAAEAAGAKGTVELLLLPPGELSAAGEGRVDLVIRNDGAGIPEDRLPQVFKPFMTTKGHNHFGLGLTLAGVLAGQMKARLGLASANGLTTAWLALPTAG
jgi:signal transduction histidine kinase